MSLEVLVFRFVNKIDFTCPVQDREERSTVVERSSFPAILDMTKT